MNDACPLDVYPLSCVNMSTMASTSEPAESSSCAGHAPGGIVSARGPPLPVLCWDPALLNRACIWGRHTAANMVAIMLLFWMAHLPTLYWLSAWCRPKRAVWPAEPSESFASAAKQAAFAVMILYLLLLQPIVEWHAASQLHAVA